MRTVRTVRRAGPLAAIALVVALSAACASFKSGPGPNPVVGELYTQVNNTRAAYGLPPLAWNDQLAGLAQGWSAHIAVTGDFSHQSLGALLGNPALAGFSGLAENIMRGTCGMSGGGDQPRLDELAGSPGKHSRQLQRHRHRSHVQRGHYRRRGRLRALTSRNPFAPRGRSVKEAR